MYVHTYCLMEVLSIEFQIFSSSVFSCFTFILFFMYKEKEKNIKKKNFTAIILNQHNGKTIIDFMLKPSFIYSHHSNFAKHNPYQPYRIYIHSINLRQPHWPQVLEYVKFYENYILSSFFSSIYLHIYIYTYVYIYTQNPQ